MPCQHLPPELWARIIAAAAVCRFARSFDWEPRPWDPATIQDLQSFSLVSQAFLLPAQALLFHDIDLSAASNSLSELSLCRRLAEIMKQSPHLAAHVIQISSTGDGGLDGSVMRLIQAIIGQCIRHVLLYDFDRLSYTSLLGILDNAGLLEGLHFVQCSALETEAWAQPTTHTSAKAKITHLSLRFSGSIAEWFIRPGFPLDFTNLIHADITASANGAIAAVLEPVREMLTSLTFLPDDLTGVTIPSTYVSDDFQSIHPRQFPALTHLGIVLSMTPDLPATLVILSEIGNPNMIQEIIYKILFPQLRDFPGLQTDALMSAFDAGITALPLPSLKRVELTFPADRDAHLQNHPIPSHVNPELFPLLNQRGLLVLTNYSR
ncbi:hypothetical protein FB451DRAFT_1181839 [Mycena latifolia]|nr:hypothetical protein FB451DRAFT_1181839 [Mycena latifolia]